MTFLYSFEEENPLCSEEDIRRCSPKIGVLKTFPILTGKHLCWSLFLIKLQVKKRLLNK